MRILGKLVVAAALVATPVMAADPVEGIWKTKPGDDGNFGHVRIYDCDGMICGVLDAAFDGSGNEVTSDNVGKRMIWDMETKGEGEYGGGKIWAPDRDKTYRSKMKLSGGNLSVSGCVAGGLICRDQIWTRVE